MVRTVISGGWTVHEQHAQTESEQLCIKAVTRAETVCFVVENPGDSALSLHQGLEVCLEDSGAGGGMATD